MLNFRYKFTLWRATTLLAVANVTLVVLALLSGILIGFNYHPTAADAFPSLQAIASDFNFGSLILSIHNGASNSLIVTGLLQIFLMFFGRKSSRYFFQAWVSGFGVAALAIAAGWTAMILDWDQLGFWRLKVELSTLGELPIVGYILNTVIAGGAGINTTTIAHLYTIHSYLLPVVIVGATAFHLLSCFKYERQEKQQVIRSLEQMVQTESQSQAAEKLKAS